MPVLYNGYELRPVQSVTFDRQTQAFGDGRTINSVVRATVKGTIVPDKIGGVEAPVDDAYKMSVILAKQKEIRDAFSVQGRTFEVQGWDGQPPAKFQARNVSVSFPESLMYSQAPYEVTLESSGFSGESAGDHHVESAGESWSVSSDTWPNKVSHTVQAKGQLVYDASGGVPKLPWEYARDFAVTQLGLGFTAVGSAFSPKSGADVAAGAEGQPLSSTSLAWNRTMTEEVNETDGTYSATEQWVLMDAPYYEDYSVSVRKVDDQPNLMVVVGVTGTVNGYAAAINDFDTRYANASSAWSGTILPGLLGRATAACGAPLNQHPTAFSVDRHPRDGTVTYQVEFNNRTLVGDTWETYGVAKKRSVEDYKTTVTVTGTVQGVSYLDTDSDPSVRFTRAQSRWPAVRGLTYARAVSLSGLTDLKPYPVRAEVTEDPAQGTVSYSYDYDNRPFADVEVTLTVGRRFSRDDARTYVTVSGKVQGLLTDPAADFFAAGSLSARFANANAYWQGIEPTLLGVAALKVDTSDQWLEAWSKSTTTDEYAGYVEFAYEFTSQVRCFPGALSESMTVTDEPAVPLIVEIPVPGKADGPVVQDTGTKTVSRRTFSAELVFPVPRACGYQPPPAVDYAQYAPRGSKVWMPTSPVQAWNWTQGRYSVTATWHYKA